MREYRNAPGSEQRMRNSQHNPIAVPRTFEYVNMGESNFGGGKHEKGGSDYQAL